MLAGVVWVGRTRRKPRSAVRPSRWRLGVRALAKQCFASKAPSPLGARWRHPWRQRSCQPTPPHPRQISGDGGRSTPCVDESPLKSNISTIWRRASTHGVDLRVDQGRHPPTAAWSTPTKSRPCIPTDRGDLSKAGWVRLRGCPRHGCRGQAPKDGFTASPATGPTPPTHRKPASASAIAVPEVAGQRPALLRVQGRRPCRPTHYLAAAICFSMSAAVTGPRKLCASLPCGSSRCVSGKPRGVAKSAGGSNGSTITIG